MVIGPKKAAAELEGSKEFAKKFMQSNNIPTAKYQSFEALQLEEGHAFLEQMFPPYVLKADGLAAGKGVLILSDLEEAKEELKKMLVDQKFGQASQKVVIEEFLSGIELSCFVLTDGKNHVTFPMAKDYKRIGEGDTGLNTGGMGAISPVPFVTPEFEEKIRTRIVEPTINGFQKDGLPFQGFVFIGLIKVGEDPYVIEYNVRMGDPETEVVLPRIKNDMVSLLKAVGNKTLDQETIEIDERSATTVMAVSGGYPEAYERETDNRLRDSRKQYRISCRTTKRKEMLLLLGARIGCNFIWRRSQASPSTVVPRDGKLSFEGIYYRKDLGFDL